MKYRIIQLLILVVLLVSCSTAPELKRDSVFDPNPTEPNGQIIFPKDYQIRGNIERLSFKIKLNKAAKGKDVNVVLKSDVDGVFYETSNVLSDTLVIYKTDLSDGNHKVDLIINGEKVSEVNLRVILPNNVLLEVEQDIATYNLKWTKHQGSDFKSYRVIAKYIDKTYNRFEEEEIDIITNVSDTVYQVIDFPYQENFSFAIEVAETSKLNVNTSNSVDIKVPAYVIDRFKQTIISTKLSKLFILDKSGLKIYNLKDNTVDNTFSFIKSDSAYRYSINAFKAQPELIVSKRDRFERYNLKSGQLISSAYTNKKYEHAQFAYDNKNDIYFVATGSRAYTVDWDNGTINYLDPNYYPFVIIAIIPDKNTLFVNGGTMIKYSDDGNFESINKTNYSTHNYLSLNSSNYQILNNADSKPVIVSVEPFEVQIELETTGSSYNTIYHSQINDDYIIGGTNLGYVYIYSLSDKSMKFSYKLNHKITSFIEIEGKLYAFIGRTEHRYYSFMHLRRIPFELK